MTTQELRKYIDRVLGNNIRCLLPSYWWKRLFGLVVDKIEEVEKKGVPKVESEAELEALDVPKGSIASVVGDLRSFSECYLLKTEDEAETIDPSLLTVIKNINVSAEAITQYAYVILLNDITASFCLIGTISDNNAILAQISSNISGTYYYTLAQNGNVLQSSVDELNGILRRETFHFMGVIMEGADGNDLLNTPAVLAYIDKYIKWGYGTSAYIKDEDWERLVKEGEIPNIDMSAINGKQDKLVSGENIKTICGEDILGSGNINPDPSMKLYIPMGRALDSREIADNIAMYSRIAGFTRYVNSWRAFAVFEEAVREVTILSATYSAANGCRVLVGGSTDNDFTDQYECVLLSDGNVTATKIEGGGSINVDAELSETSENAVQNKVVTSALNNKQDKIEGKQLSTEDFTTALKDKLNSLNNYDDAELTEAINKLRSDFDTLLSGDASTAIDTFNDIIAFLDGIEDTQNLKGIIASIELQIAGKLDKAEAASTYATKTELNSKGTYSKPSTGIPKTDLASGVQSALTIAESLSALGTLYKAAWIATKTEGISQKYTETITLPAGTYIISAVLPYAKVGHGNQICIGFTAQMAIGVGNTFLDASYGCTTMLATFTTSVNLAVMSAASANSAEWDYLDRGGMAALRIK